MAQITIEQAMQIAVGHHQAGRFAEAERLYREVLRWVPNHHPALHLLGVLAGQTGHADAAMDLIGQAIAINPTVAEYYNDLGESYRRATRYGEAIARFRRAIALQPGQALAHINLVSTLAESGRFEETIAASRQALEILGDTAEIEGILGFALVALGRRDEAIAAYRRAIALDPGDADAYYNLGNNLLQKGELGPAITALRQALALKPGHVRGHNNLGVALHANGCTDEAIAAYNQALRLAPDSAEVLNNLGTALKSQGRLDEALACNRRAIEIRPDFLGAESDLLFNLHYHPAHDAQAILAEHRRWAQRHADPLAAEIRPHGNDRTPGRRLRIGYVCQDFKGETLGRLLIPLFAHHDPCQFEFLAYSDVWQGDAVTQKLKSDADGWQDIVSLSDAQMTERIREDRIDILVDLALHIPGNRLLVFARKPAPVQVTMLSLPTTTGLATIDYRLTDPYLDPPGQGDADYTEQSIRLPRCFWCYQPPEEPPPVSDLPAAKHGFVTLGCLNHPAKVNRQVLQLWSKILLSLPGSRLVLHSPPGSHRDAIRTLFQQDGIAPDRIEFAGSVAFRTYLERYHNLDLCLDPFPYNGGVTTMDALWMGVPVITLAGRTAVGREGVSILSNLGLPDLIAQTPPQYVALAVGLAGDRTRLAELRSSLRQRMRCSPLMDGRQYAADVEAAFRLMWQTWCGH